MNKKIMMSFMSITAALVVMGGATYAAFSGQATLADNTFASGNADLQISTNGVDFGTNVSGFTGSNVFPGYSETFNFSLKNNSGSPIALNTIAKLVGVSGTGANQELLQDSMTATFLCGGDPIAGPFSLNAWEAGQAQVSANLAQGATETCQMVIDLPTSADNSVSGTSVNFDVQFDATQVTP